MTRYILGRILWLVPVLLFVSLAARSLGASTPHVLVRHPLPNAAGPVAMAMLAFNFLGDGLCDALDPYTSG